MGKTLAIADVRREIQKAITKLRILPSDTIAVLPGDHPMQPSVIAGPPGGPVLGPVSSTDNAWALWDGPTGDLLKDSTVTWNGSILQLGEVSGGVDVTLRTAAHLTGVSGDLIITTGGSPGQPGVILIQPAGSPGTNPGVDNTFAGGNSGTTAIGGTAIVVGGSGSDADGGEVHLDGGDVLGTGDKGNVVIQGNLIIFPNGSMSTPVSFDTPLITTDELGDSGSGEVTMLSDLDLNGQILFGNQTVMGVGFDGGGSTILAGTEIEVHVEQGFTIDSWLMIADGSGSIEIDIWKDTFGNYPPTVADTITAGNEPAILSDDKGSDSVLTGWDTTVNDGDILKFHVNSAATITRVSLYLIGTRT